MYGYDYGVRACMSYADYVEPLVDGAGWAWVVSARWVLMDPEGRTAANEVHCTYTARRMVG